MSTFLFPKLTNEVKPIKYAYLPKPVKKEENLINDAIRFPKVMLVDDDGQNYGVIDIKKAQDIAMSKELDLVCVAPQGKPPVCKLMNYSKFRYEKEKKEKEMAKNQKIVEIKEIQLSPVIAKHDFETKLNQGRKFLEHGDKVKVTLFIKRRYFSLMNQAMQNVIDYCEACNDIAQTDKKPEFDGKSIQVTISPKKKQ